MSSKDDPSDARLLANARTAGPGCDAPRVIVTTIQDGRTRICVAVTDAANATNSLDAQFSYIRYAKADEFRVTAKGNEEPVFNERSLPCEATETRDWYAWIGLMPPRTVRAECDRRRSRANPGVTPLLIPKQPQGINPRILLMDLYLRQEPATGSSPVGSLKVTRSRAATWRLLVF
jgi:hypothetical protein